MITCLIISGLGAVFALVMGFFLYTSSRKKQALLSMLLFIALLSIFILCFVEVMKRLAKENDDYLERERKTALVEPLSPLRARL